MNARKLLVVTSLGYARLFALPQHGRALTFPESAPDAGAVVVAMVVGALDDVVLHTRAGQSVRVEVWSGSAQRRLLSVAEGDEIAGVERIADPDGVLGEVGQPWQ